MAEELTMLVPEFGEVPAVPDAAHNLTVPVGVCADGPALADRTVGQIVSEFLLETPTTPELVVEYGAYEQKVAHVLAPLA